MSELFIDDVAMSASIPGTMPPSLRGVECNF